MNEKSTISERIKIVRGTNTQKEFADRLGITQRAVVNYESLGRTPKGAVLKKICENVSIPVAAIGGINQENISLLKNTGISGVAVVSAIFAENDIQSAAAALKKSILEITGD